MNQTLLQTHCDKLKPISLAEMKGICLMNRVDTKYLAPSNLLLSLLELAEQDFRIQQVDGVTVSHYSTQYYDTADLEMYTLHHNGNRPRQKVRLRSYIDSRLHFLEIKKKNNKGRTDKVRIVVDEALSLCDVLSPKVHNFLVQYSPYDEQILFPHIRSLFDRITLVNNNLSERITIDTNLFFHNCRNGKEVTMPELMIIELKQDGKVYSKIRELLADCRIPAVGISKYCLGTVLTDPTAKGNRFKAKIRYINKLTNQQK